MSCVRSTTLRPSASSRLRSCAGDQLVVEDDDAGVGLVAGGGQRVDLPLPRKVAGIGPRALLHHAQDDRRAGGGGQAGELVERMFGIELTGCAVEEADERRTLADRAWRIAAKPNDASLQRF